LHEGSQSLGDVSVMCMVDPNLLSRSVTIGHLRYFSLSMIACVIADGARFSQFCIRFFSPVFCMVDLDPLSRSLTLFHIIHDIYGNNEDRIFQFLHGGFLTQGKI
jgi:hypothetical protein